MLFNSIDFIFGFLPVVLAGYWLLVATHLWRARLYYLVLASMVFYGWWSPEYLLLLLALMVVNFIAAWTLQGAERNRKALMLAGVAGNLLVLFYFKYLNFAVGNINKLLSHDIKLEHIALPLAISFFTFQKIALLVDIYNKKVRVRRFDDYATFVLFFPQLIAGPIVHYSELEPQLSKRPLLSGAAANILIGLVIFAIGLFKKTVLADTMALYATPTFDGAAGGQAVGFIQGWAGAFAYTLQIYFDFSGYSDMAIGLARMFGVVLPLNFHSPLRATNIAELWRRWHMTLSRFVQSYVFKPLALPLARRAARNEYRPFASLALSNLAPTMLAMIIIGVWHGAGWNFVIFGALHGSYIVAYECWTFWRRKRRRKHAGTLGTSFAWGLTVLCFAFAVVPFRSSNVETTASLFSAMLNPLAQSQADWLSVLPLGGAGLVATLAIGLAIVGLMPNTQQFMSDWSPALEWAKWRNVAPPRLAWRWRPVIGWAAVSGVILSVAIAFISRGATEFIYFNF